MKLIRIFGLVFGLHVFVISILFILPACQTTPKEAESSSASTGWSENSYEPSPEGRPSGELDPSFNAGLPDESPSSGRSGRYPPTRPEGGFTPFDSEMGTLEPLGGELEPTLTTYKVKKGDNLWKIADRHGISLDELLEANGFDRDEMIFVGDEIYLPVYSSLSEGDFLGGQTTAGEYSVEYKVQSGDTLSGIASRAGITVARLKWDNGLTGDTIYAGQKLSLPQGTSKESLNAPAPVREKRKERGPSEGEATHIVVEGETPSGIAAQYGMETSELMRRNRITDATKLKVGQKLVVKAKEEESSPSFFSRIRSGLRKTEEKEPEAPEIEPVVELPPTLEELDTRDDEIVIPVVPLRPEEEK